MIGGWAIWLLTKTLKSKDIDIIVDFKELTKLKEKFQIKKNQHLKKYELVIDEVDIDIYVPYYSDLGVPLNKIKTITIQGFKIPEPQYLLVMKQYTYHKREGPKKEKDLIDIFALTTVTDLKKYLQLTKELNKPQYVNDLIALIRSFKDYQFLNITPRKFKLMKNQSLKNLDIFKSSSTHHSEQSLLLCRLHHKAQPKLYYFPYQHGLAEQVRALSF